MRFSSMNTSPARRSSIYLTDSISRGSAIPMRLMMYLLRDDVRVSQETMGSAIEEIFVRIHGRAKTDTLLRSIVDHLPSELLLQ